MHSAELLVAGERLLLHPHRALHWPRMNWLVLSDLHLGKAAHFRKAGVPLPEGHDARTLARLDELIAQFDPKRVVIIGDLFHSAHNGAWDLFHEWCRAQRTEIHLVQGNHDLLAQRRYRDAGIIVHPEELIEGPLRLAHEPPPERTRVEPHTLCGHLHPGIVLHGKGGQHLRLPCFLRTRHFTLLPAFGTNTGLLIVKPAPDDRVFVCAPRSVMELGARPVAADP